MPSIVIDFETRSRAELRRTGQYLYAMDPSTRILCLAWNYPGEYEVHLWHPVTSRWMVKPPTKTLPAVWHPGLPEEGQEELARLLDAVRQGAALEAHNAAFERSIWRFVGARMHGWPIPAHDQWHCSAALAASHSLPRKLQRATEALSLVQQKDADGASTMLKMCKPAKPTKTRPDREWIDDPEDYETLYRYCRQDVRTERCLSDALFEMHPDERHVWLLDQEINERGFCLDHHMVDGALRIGPHALERINDQLTKVTGGAVQKYTARADLLVWLRDQGVWIPEKINARGEWVETVDADARESLLGIQSDIPPVARTVLELWTAAAKSSTKKYAAMNDRVCIDGRVRDNLTFYAANTGRWGGAGVQPQNFPHGFDVSRRSDKDANALIAELCDDVSSGDVDLLTLNWGDPMRALSNALRGAIIAPPGHELAVADFSAIEARVTFWCARAEQGLDVFRRGEDVYKWQAAKILWKDAKDITKQERQVFGKVPVLGCGYQMGGDKLETYAASMGITIENEQAHELVTGYRETFPEVVQMWRDMNEAAVEAVRQRDRGARNRVPVEAGRARWAIRGRFLLCQLPSGRCLAYLDPKLEKRLIEPKPGAKNQFEPFMKEVLTFMGEGTYTNVWDRHATYGGKLVENVVQAISRDLLRDAMLRVGAPYNIVLTVHDEIVAEVPEGQGDVHAFERLVAEVPPWAEGLPIAAEGWIGRRYRK
jgi:DNA polymerase